MQNFLQLSNQYLFMEEGGGYKITVGYKENQKSKQEETQNIIDSHLAASF